jgi:choline dehydrogenase-like flavoprotein
MALEGRWTEADIQFRERLGQERKQANVDFDAVVVGTGFGGAVTACRLVQAGFEVCILERGRRYGPTDFPKYPVDDLFASSDDGSATRQFTPPPDFSRWLWSQDHGLYDVRDLGASVAVQAAGYGGGSLIYANVHLRPPHHAFDDWPQPYSGETLKEYFDLAAYMLGAAPVPRRLAKTLQLQRAAQSHPGSWFLTPLAINFTARGLNPFGREQNPCDMRARCWRGCDHQAKNTLDLNYLAVAEDVGCSIFTMAEVMKITRRDGGFIVDYADRLRREPPADHSSKARRTRQVTARYVFLCAGSVNTTELLLRSQATLGNSVEWQAARRSLGSHYFPNSDSLAAVFDCDQPHEADYGPTITSALLYDQPANDGEFACSIEFTNGSGRRGPTAGMKVTSTSNGTALLAHPPICDSGAWNSADADGTLVVTEIGIAGAFNAGDRLTFHAGDDLVATAQATSGVRRQREWFLVEDGGYPSDVEPLVGIFRSPLWLRRNRYLETPWPSGGAVAAEQPSARQTTPLRRPPAGVLRVGAFTEALGGTSAEAFRGEGTVPRGFSAARSFADSTTVGPARELLLPGLLSDPLENFFPSFFVQALRNDRMELIGRAAAMALPVLSRILDDLSASVATQIDPDTRRRLSQEEVDDRQVEVLVRGLVRQVLQILAGTEVTLATKAAQAMLNPIPETPQQVVNLLANALLWALGYNQNAGHTAVLLTMGRDNYRGRLDLELNRALPLQATLPTRVLDTTSATHERVLREIAMKWNGELRTNPGWTTLEQRVTVHSQGGCPMGEPGRSVTTPEGEVHGCDGLYVMDAAAFPSSVGVNPSATIAAVAEYKVERFIQSQRRDQWRAPDRKDVQRWIDDHGGDEAIDPLNFMRENVSIVTSRPAPSRANDVLGLSFVEEMQGFCAPISERQYRLIDFDNLSRFPRKLRRFVRAEGAAVASGTRPLSIRLCVKVPDLARLIAGGKDLNPVNLRLSGKVQFQGSPPLRSETFRVDRANSFLQIFVDPKSPGDARRFFRYHVQYGNGYVIDGVKVLEDAPGFDAWHDTSTVYAQLTSPTGFHRGVLRVSIETFVRKQMPSMRITGTNDPARQSWALLAFYQYFAGELTDIYMTRAEAVKDALIKLVTSIHV